MISSHHYVKSRAVEVELTERFQLTPRERQILSLIASGMSNKDIADMLKIGLQTAKSHLINIMGKLGVDSRTSAAAIYLRLC